MARYSERNTETTYEAAKLFREKCLEGSGSLLFDNVSLWTQPLVQRLHDCFVGAPDAGDRPFLEKFRDQITPAGRDVIRLAAEMLVVYFLFPSRVTGDRKRAVVGEILSWSEDVLPAQHLVSRAFASGIGSGGQGYNTRRHQELWFLIEFVLAWKGLSSGEPEKALADPWVFQEFVDGIDGADSRQLRHMLLHLTFPDHFERIASGHHKARVLEAFKGIVQTPPDDEDRHLYAVRKELEALLPGQELDFYWEPLEAAWYDSAEGDSDAAPLELIQHKKQVVLYGPPGTGKTYQAKRLAERIIRSAALEKFGPARYFKEQAAIKAALESNFHRLQLHPAYSYEDFVRALHLGRQGETEYRLGYLPNLIAAMRAEDAETRLPHVLVLDEMNRTDLSRMLGECFSLLENRDEPIDLPGQDKDGKVMRLQIPDDLYFIGTMNLIDQSIEQIDFALRRRFLWVACPFDGEALLNALRSRWKKHEARLEWDRLEPEFSRLVEAAHQLNERVRASPSLGAHYEIGHAYFLDVIEFLSSDLGRKPRTRKSFLWQGEEPRRAVTQLWELSLRPLLDQYLSGLDARTRDSELERLNGAFYSNPSVAE